MKKYVKYGLPYVVGLVALFIVAGCNKQMERREHNPREAIISSEASNANPNEMYVSAIRISPLATPCQPHPRKGTGFCYTLSKEEYAHVTIRDGKGDAVAGAVVSGKWSNCLEISATAITNSVGEASIKGKACGRNCTLVFTITQVDKPGIVYNASANLISQASKTCN